MRTKQIKTRGFTIVELLTVMAVIAILIGLLIPALNLVRDNAKKVQQKAQFHAIDVGVELYKSDFGSYPESRDNSNDTTSSPQKTNDPTPYCGANKLAEAMVGLDLLGFHPNSDFCSDGLNTVVGNDGTDIINTDVYHAFTPTGNWETAEENIQARKGPYVDLENANAFRMDEVYSDARFPGVFLANYDMDTASGSVASYPLVLCDVYAKKRSGVGGKKTGTPILYYRARNNFKMQDFTEPATDPLEDDIYYYDDNSNLLALGMPDDGILFTVETGGARNAYENFENMIINEQVQTIRRPYRADSYILVSAGKDGDFGTADDIFNFEKDVIE